MVAVGGSLIEFTLAGRVFSVAADGDSNRSLKGYNNEIVSNGDGSVRMIKTMMPWKHDGIVAVVDDQRGDHEFIQGLSDLKDLFPITATYASGITYQGNGQIVGEFQYSSQSSTCTLSLSGELNFTAQ